ncbi:MAG TPA: Trp family transcriptional regulator [Candidatus Limnocylindria bacterium]|nr:Trp family transcriptional regulator [Candidatus Limnocylindria bacterium]
MSDFSAFVKLVYSIQEADVLEDLLVGITTPHERLELSQRLEIVKRLIAGEPQHKIARELGVGVGTVTRGSKELAAGRFKALRVKSEH